MKPACEIVVSKVLPSIRAAIVKVLIEEHKMQQTEVARIMGISQGSISLYTTCRRGCDKEIHKLFPEIEKYAKEVAVKIASGKLKKTSTILCTVCRKIRKSKEFCDIHKQFAQLV